MPVLPCATSVAMPTASLGDLVKEKEISEDEERRATGEIDDLTKKFVAKIDADLAQKEKDLMAV